MRVFFVAGAMMLSLILYYLLEKLYIRLKLVILTAYRYYVKVKLYLAL